MMTMNRLAVEETAGQRQAVYKLHVVLAEVMEPEYRESLRDWRKRAFALGLLTRDEVEAMEYVGGSCCAAPAVELMARRGVAPYTT